MAPGTRIRWGRQTVRLLLLATAVLFSLGGPLPVWCARLFPSASSLVLCANTLAARRWYVGLYWAVPPVFFLVVSFWRGRFFCRWVCPAGTIYSLAGRFGVKRRLLHRRLNGILAWIILGASLAGLPMLLFLDPTATWNRLALTWNGTLSTAALVPGLVFPALLVLCAVQPAVWCTHLCPLGYLYELGGRFRRSGWIGRRLRKTKDTVEDVQSGTSDPAVGRTDTPDPIRREIAAGLLLGVPLGLILKRMRLSVGKPGADPLPILPPGAGDVARFNALCTRCYACVNICPTKVLQVRFRGGRPVMQLFFPEMDMGAAFCDQFCNRCTQVCPTGAILPLSVETKRIRQIGIAQVRRDACLAWADGEYCTVCQEFCPYRAIDNAAGPGDLPRPVVNADLCRGCGVCQYQCPAVRVGKAIIVHPVPAQFSIET